MELKVVFDKEAVNEEYGSIISPAFASCISVKFLIG
jgi:hypothetical protein